MTKDEKVAHRKKLGRIRQQRSRDKRKSALSLVPPENLPMRTGHRLGKKVHSDLEEKAKARKRAKTLQHDFNESSFARREKTQGFLAKTRSQSLSWGVLPLEKEGI